MMLLLRSFYCRGRRRSRRRAVFFRAALLAVAFSVLGGCSVASSPALVTLRNLVPVGGPDVGAEARKIRYASLDFHVASRGGLLIMAEQSDGVTFWQTSRRENIALRDGYLESTHGFAPELTMTEITAASGAGVDASMAPWRAARPKTYGILRSWIEKNGSPHTERARAQMACTANSELIELPLARLELQRCRETLDWARGARTVSTYWRDPNDHRIWAAKVVPWPGAPEYDWKVARPWW